jgi:excinuclease ABC subunit C
VLRLDPKAEWPRLELVRQIPSDRRKDGSSTSGPYHSASSARHTLRVVNRHFKLRTCTDYVLEHRTRPCLQHQIGRCPGAVRVRGGRERLRAQVMDVGLFLDGRHRELVDGLRARCRPRPRRWSSSGGAAARSAGGHRDHASPPSRWSAAATLDQDVIGMYREGGQVEFVVMHVRQGKLLGTRDVTRPPGMELPDAEVLADFFGLL